MFLWLDLTFKSIWHQRSMTYCHSGLFLALPFRTSIVSKRAAFVKWSITKTFPSVARCCCFYKEFKDFYCSRDCCCLLLLWASASEPCVAPTTAKKSSFLWQHQSVCPWVAELQTLCGLGYLSEGLESDLFYSVLWKRPVRECWCSLKLQPWSSVLQPGDWQEKWS